jgi:4'-phosphopantetheinyl transferase
MTFTSDFRSVSRSQPELQAGQVHLWKCELGAVPERLYATLSPGEWLRCSKFHFAVDSQRYIATRAMVRSILAGYLDEDPAALTFEARPGGKPVLSNGASFLRFNLSHSNDLMLLAVTFGREVGVDLEAVREPVHFEMLAEHYFSPEDQWSLRITPAAQRCRRFFELWTRTEARLKAYGRGLGDVVPRTSGSDLAVRSFEPAHGYAAALAVEGDDFDLTCWQWRS